MYGAVAYASAPYGGSIGGTTLPQTIELPLMGSQPTMFEPSVVTYYPYFTPPQNEVQTITLTGAVSTFTLTFSGDTTTALSGSASPAEVQAALEALPSIGAGNVVVTGLGPYDVEFVGTLGYTDVPDVTVATTGGSGSSTLTEVAVAPEPWWTPEAEPGQLSTPRGITVGLVPVPTSPGPGVATPITDSFDRNWQDSIDADGSGSLSVESIDATPGQDVLRFALHGAPAFQVLVDTIKDVEVHADEEYSQQLTLSGRGAVALLADASILPDFGLSSRPIGDTRYFNFAAKTLPTTGWTQAVRTLPRYNAENYFGRPKGMVDALLTPAHWLWDRPAHVPVPGGDVYFRQWFTYSGTKTILARLEAAADDEVQVWVDGVPVLNIEGVYAGSMSYTTIELSPGTHLVACRGRNRNELRAGIIWSIGTMDSQGNFKDVIANSNAADTLCLGYPDNPPGFAIGQAARQLIIEAQARGEIPFIDTSFGSFYDSNGTEWPITSELSCTIDSTLHDAFRVWAETYWEIALGSADFRLHGWIKGQRGTDVNATWDAGNELIEFERDTQDYPTHAIVRYDGGRIEVENPEALAARGRRKVVPLQLGDARSPSQARYEALKILDNLYRRRESVAVGIDVLTAVDQAYSGVWVGDSPLVTTPGSGSNRLRVHSLTVSDDGDEVIVVPEVVSANVTDEERMAIAAFFPGSAAGRVVAARRAPNITFPGAQTGSEQELDFSWEDVSGPVSLIVYANNGVDFTTYATLNPGAGTVEKTTLEPPIHINPLSKIVVKVGTALSQEKRTDRGVWILNFSVDRDVDPTRGTAELLLA